VACLFENMRIPAKQDERDECLASVLAHTYLLAGRLGLKYDELDTLLKQALKRETLKNEYSDEDILFKYLSEVRK
jgi:hypothetical protein